MERRGVEDDEDGAASEDDVGLAEDVRPQM